MADIVVIEDDASVSRIIGDMLRESNHQVVSYFAPSTDILEHVKEYRPDLVILDARLNDSVSGWDIIAALKEDSQTRFLPIILCTAARDQLNTHRAMLQRYDIPVLEKPFDIDDLDALVDRMLVKEA